MSISEDSKLDRIHADFPDDTFNRNSEKRAKKEENALFGKKAQESFHTVSAWYISVLGWVGLAIIVAVLLVRTWHLLAPDKCLWLTPEAIKQIDHILVGIVAGLSARFFPKIKTDKEE